MDTENKKQLGRPSKYNADMQAHAEAYLLNHANQGDVVPSIAGLCCWLGIKRSTAYEWRDTYPLFSDTLEAIKEKQEVLALNRGLDGTFNSTIVKLLLANHGYSDKSEIDHTTKGGAITPTFANLYGTNAKPQSD